MDEVLEASCDLLLLDASLLGREDVVDLAVGVRPERVHEALKVCVLRAAVGAVGQMLGDRRIHGFAAAGAQVTLEQTLFFEVPDAEYHAFPPSRPRSLRAARNR
jgi:hypothetical protein